MKKVKFGQNFFTNNGLAKSIADLINIPAKSQLVEIGCGNGIFTNLLCKKYSLLVYEIDKSLQLENSNVSVIYKDFLKAETNKHTYYWSNLPFYICTKILLKILTNKSFLKGYFIVPDYFVTRIKNDTYLKFLFTFTFKTKVLMKIARSNYRPIPMIKSTFLIKVESRGLSVSSKFIYYCRKIYSSNKTLKNNFKNSRKEILPVYFYNKKSNNLSPHECYCLIKYFEYTS